MKAELFPAEIRALGVGLGYALANSVFGGTAPVLYQASKPDHVTLFIVYVTVVIGVSLLVYIFGLKNKGRRCSTASRAAHGRCSLLDQYLRQSLTRKRVQLAIPRTTSPPTWTRISPLMLRAEMVMRDAG